MYFLAIWFCPIFRVCGLFSSDCRTVALAYGVHTVVGELAPGVMQIFSREGWVLAHWWVLCLVSRAISRSTFTGNCGVRRTLSSLFAEGWVCVSTWSLCPSTGAYRLFWGQALPKWWPLGELTLMNTSWKLGHQLTCPHSEPQPTCTFSQGPSTLLSSGSKCVWNLVCAPQEWSLFPQSYGAAARKPTDPCSGSSESKPLDHQGSPPALY